MRPVLRTVLCGAAALPRALVASVGVVSALALCDLAPAAQAVSQAVSQSAAVLQVARSAVTEPATRYDTSPPLGQMRPSHVPGAFAVPVRSGPLLPSATSHTPAATTPTFSLTSPLTSIAGVNFDGIGYTGKIPPDPNGAAGPNQYVELVNASLAVYSKTGELKLGPESTNTLWGEKFGGLCETTNNGDGTVLFDTLSQRWVVQQFAFDDTTKEYFDCVAVSSTSDATGSWHRYSFKFARFPDYPKMGVWSDAYYGSYNMFENASGGGFVNVEVCAFDRAKMLNGEAASKQCFAENGFTLMPATLDGSTAPPSGESEWFVSLASGEALSYWKFHVDFANSKNTTFTGPASLKVESFSEAVPIPQNEKETTQKLDALGNRLMFRLAYRNFGSHESLVVSHAVNTEPSAGTSSVGMRWYELRANGGSLSVYQQGTYGPDASYRWMGSIAMDKVGDAALGYSVSSSTLDPQIRYTGRLVADPLGSMGQETTLFEGKGVQTGFSRWGDYTDMAIDPSDDCTFWYVNEYLPSTGHFWSTRVGSFRFRGCKTETILGNLGPASGEFNDPVTLGADLTVKASGAPVPARPVVLSIGTQSCVGVTNSAGHASCEVTLEQKAGSYTLSASFAGDSTYEPTTASAPFAITQEESHITYTGETTADYHDPFTASATLVDPEGGAPIAGKTITFALGVGDTCNAVTNAAGEASCSITPTQKAGPYTIKASFGPDTNYVSSSDSKPFTITREQTTTTYTGPTVILKGASGVTLSGLLREDGVTPISGRALTLSLGTQSCTGVTNASGEASCKLTFSGKLGPQPLAASFAGDAYYLPSSDTSKTAIVFSFPSKGAFALGDLTVAGAGSAPVTWWSEDWAEVNSLSGGPAPTSFKGFVAHVTLPTGTPPAGCAGPWTTDRPLKLSPPGSVPSYMGVLVTSSVSEAEDTISGNTTHIVVVKTEPGYGPTPRHHGTGTLVGTYC